MIRRLPPLRSLEAFIRVVRAGSAKTAAAELALSPSALSQPLINSTSTSEASFTTDVC